MRAPRDLHGPHAKHRPQGGLNGGYTALYVFMCIFVCLLHIYIYTTCGRARSSG